jgi:hypothetical protein
LSSPKEKQPSGDFIVMKKSANMPSGRIDCDEDDVHAQYKRHIAEKGKKSPSPHEIKTGIEKEIYKSSSTSKQGLDIRSAAKQILELKKNDNKDNLNKGNHTFFPHSYWGTSP